MSGLYENYLPSGYCHTATTEDPRRGFEELRLYNPTTEPCEARMTVYFADRSPRLLPPISVPARKHTCYNTMPALSPEVFDDCGLWGARILSTTALIAILVGGMRIMPEQPRFRGGAENFHGTRLHREWHFPNGVWVDWSKCRDSELRALARFNEMEIYHFLNPNLHTAGVTMTLRYRHLDPAMVRLTIPAERVVVWENRGQVHNGQPYAVRVTSSEPISVAAVRHIYGLRGLDEWGLQVRCHMFGVPGSAIK